MIDRRLFCGESKSQARSCRDLPGQIMVGGVEASRPISKDATSVLLVPDFVANCFQRHGRLLHRGLFDIAGICFENKDHSTHWLLESGPAWHAGLEHAVHRLGICKRQRSGASIHQGFGRRVIISCHHGKYGVRGLSSRFSEYRMPLQSLPLRYISHSTKE